MTAAKNLRDGYNSSNNQLCRLSASKYRIVMITHDVCQHSECRGVELDLLSTRVWKFFLISFEES